LAGVIIREIRHVNYGRCIEMSNGEVDLIVTVDCGPRIIRFGLNGKENEFCESDAEGSATYGNELWYTRGGHRFWHSPESFPRTYIADNQPVEYQVIDQGIRVIQQSEPWTQIQKMMEISLSPQNNIVNIKHRLVNKNAWPVKLAAWAITVMAVGGKEIIPNPQRDTGLLPNRTVALWPYSKMNDSRICWGDLFTILAQNPKMKEPFKFGVSNEAGWAAYVNHGNLFIKRYVHKLGAEYPDFGVSYETYTTDFMLEMESLSPLVLLEPEAELEHEEEWELIAGVDFTAAVDRLFPNQN